MKHQGEILATLMRHLGYRKGRTSVLMEIRQADLNEFLQMEELPKHILDKACQVFNVKPEYFEEGLEGEKTKLLKRLESCGDKLIHTQIELMKKMSHEKELEAEVEELRKLLAKAEGEGKA